jgi:hypothetical protein
LIVPLPDLMLEVRQHHLEGIVAMRAGSLFFKPVNLPGFLSVEAT